MLKLAGEFIEGQLADHEAALDPHLVETLPVLLKGGNLLHIPINAGWILVTAGSGTDSQLLSAQRLSTGTTASSKALLHDSRLLGFEVGVVNWFNINWDKKLYYIFNYGREASDSEVIGRVQIKPVSTEGALVAKGIGIRVDNYALKGESYGTALGVVDLGVSLTTTKTKQIIIILYPSSKIEWYVNGVLKGTQSTLDNIPSGSGESRLVNSIINGATGGVNTTQFYAQPKIWQER